MNQLGWIFFIVSCVGIAGCKQQATPAPKKRSNHQSTSQPTSRPVVRKKSKKHQKEWSYARPQKAWSKKRVEEAQKRLKKTKAGAIIWQSIQASGGLQKWFMNGPLHFRLFYESIKKKKRTRDTIQTVDTWSSRAVHIHKAKPKWSFGWDGKKAWYRPKGVKQGINARFWALLPYYFVGIPFVLADKGVVLKLKKPTKMQGKKYDLIHASFQSGTGDASNDYYVVYVNQKTKRIGGVRYVVSYPGYYPKGGHSPEKLMFYDGTQTINGIHFPKTFRTLRWNVKTQKQGKLVYRVAMQDVSFKPNVPSSFFHIPKDAEFQKGWK